MVQKFVQSIVKGLIKWTPSGLGTGLTIYALSQQDWSQSVPKGGQKLLRLAF